MRSLDESFVRATLPRRSAAGHKGSFGTLHILAGSARYRGAAVLATAGALRAGAGLVRLCSVEKACAAAAAQLPCAILLPLRESTDGGICQSEAPRLLEGRPTAFAAGSGMGNSTDTAALCVHLLAEAQIPLLLDADMLNALAGHLAGGQEEGTRARLLGLLRDRKAPTVLTPHVGEMARLCGAGIDEIEAAPAQTAAAFAARYGCTVVLKSHITHIAGPDGALYVNDATGNAGLAKGGSGDVLGGIVASLLAQGLPPTRAAAAAVWLHGRAADRLAEACGLYALSPADLPGALAGVLCGLGR